MMIFIHYSVSYLLLTDVFWIVFAYPQDLTNISPRRYESKTVPTKGTSSKIKRKATDNGQAPSAAKKSKG